MNSQEQMQALEKAVSIMAKLLQEDMDIAVYLTDTEKCIAYYPGKTIDVGVRSGDPIRVEEPVYDIIHKKINYNQTVPKEVFGKPFRGIGRPIFGENGKVIGALALSKSIEREMEMAAESDNVFSSLEEVNASVQEMTAMTQSLAEYLSNIQQLSEKTNTAIQQADSIINGIQSVATQSNLLALNATIEAARVGAAGKAFSVVAEEMKNLSNTSKESADAVAKMLNDMKDSISDITHQINRIFEESKTQAASTEQISAAIEGITKSSEKLLSLSKQ